VLDYDKEAGRYDATRGGDARADAAAAAIAALLPANAARLVDLACGTGIVTARLAGPGLAVLGVDRSAGMASVATRRLPGQIIVADAARTPLRAGCADAVTIIWLLHLLGMDGSGRVIAEAARVLRPGGLLITTVDKNGAAGLAGDDISRVIWPVRAEADADQRDADQCDAAGRVVSVAAACGMQPWARTTFAGAGQGRSPSQCRAQLRDRRYGWAAEVGADRVQRLDGELAALPGQDRFRPDPVYTLLSLRKRA